MSEHSADSGGVTASAPRRALTAARSAAPLRRGDFLSKALDDLNVTVLSLLDVPDHMRSILGDACAAIGASVAYVELREDGRWAVRHAVGLSEQVLGRALTPASKIAKRVAHWRDVVAIDQLGPDVVADVRRLGGDDVASALVAPLVVGGKVRGLMTFLAGTPFDEPAEDFARKLATSVSLALHAAELLDAEGRRAELAESLDRLSQLVHARLDPAEVLSVALNEGCAVLGTAGLVAVPEGGRWLLTHQCGLSPELVGQSFESSATPVIEVDPEGLTEPIPIDPATDGRIDSEFVARFGLVGVLAVPVISNGELAATVAFASIDPSRPTFTSEENDFARRLGAAVSLAYENARLYQLQLESARLSDRLSAIDEMLHSTLEFDEIAQSALEVGAEALQADSAAISFREDGVFRVGFAHGFAPGMVGTVMCDDDEFHSLLALQTAQVVAISDTSADERCDTAHMVRYGVAAVIVAPLIVRSEPIACLYYNFGRPHPITNSEMEFVSRIASSLSLALANAQQYAAERTIAQTLQEALLALPDEVPGVQVAHVYESAALQARVGGDFYDIFELDHGLLGLVVGDVSGKGLDAAVLTALVKNTIRAHAVVKGNKPSDVLARVNTVLLKESRPETFVTVFFSMLDRRDGRLVYCNAGHPAAVVLREDGIARRLAPNSPIAGAFANAPFADGEAHVGLDDLLFLYTDGLTEARRGRELYGEQRLFVQLAQVCDTEPSEAIGRVVDDVVAFAGGQLADDVAVLAVKRVPLPSDAPVQMKLTLWALR